MMGNPYTRKTKRVNMNLNEDLQEESSPKKTCVSQKACTDLIIRENGTNTGLSQQSELTNPPSVGLSISQNTDYAVSIPIVFPQSADPTKVTPSNKRNSTTAGNCTGTEIDLAPKPFFKPKLSPLLSKSWFKGYVLSYKKVDSPTSNSLQYSPVYNTSEQVPPPIANSIIKAVLHTVSKAYAQLKKEILEAYPWFDEETSFPQKHFFCDVLPKAAEAAGDFKDGTVSLMSTENMEDYIPHFRDPHLSTSRLVMRFNRGRYVMMVPDINIEAQRMCIYIYHQDPAEIMAFAPELYLYGMHEIPSQYSD